MKNVIDAFVIKIANVLLILMVTAAVLFGAYYFGGHRRNLWWENYIKSRPEKVVSTTTYVKAAADSGRTPGIPKILIKIIEDRRKIDSLIVCITELRYNKDSVIAVLAECQETTFGNSATTGIVWVKYHPVIWTGKPEFEWKIDPAPARIDSVVSTTLVEIPKKWYEEPIFLVPLGMAVGVGSALLVQNSALK